MKIDGEINNMKYKEFYNCFVSIFLNMIKFQMSLILLDIQIPLIHVHASCFALVNASIHSPY